VKQADFAACTYDKNLVYFLDGVENEKKMVFSLADSCFGID
jgi:hypothetical protein